MCVRVFRCGLGSELLSRRVPDSWTVSSAYERAVGVGAHFESYMTGQCSWHSSKKKTWRSGRLCQKVGQNSYLSSNILRQTGGKNVGN